MLKCSERGAALKMVPVFNGGDCLLQPPLSLSLGRNTHTHTQVQTASAEAYLMQVTSAWSTMKQQGEGVNVHAAGCSDCKLALKDTVNLLACFVDAGVRLLCRWIRLCLNITCPRENCNEVDLVNGNLSITISQLAVHSITALACPAACNYLLIWPTELSSSNGCVGVRRGGVSIGAVGVAEVVGHP